MEQDEHWWKGASVSQKRKNRKAEKLKSRKEEKQRNRKSRKAEQSNRNPQAKGQTKRKTKDRKKQEKKTSVLEIDCASGWRMRWCSASVMTRYAWQKVRIPQTVSFSVFHYFQHTETHKCYHKRDHARTASVTSPQPAVEEVKPYLLYSRAGLERSFAVRTGRRRVKPGWLHKLGLHRFCFRPELGRAMECVLHRPKN